MRNGVRLWLLLTVVVGLIFLALTAAELQRDWSRAPTVQPVVLILSPADGLPLDSVGVSALDRQGARFGVPLVNGAWVAADVFVSRLEFSLPRTLEHRLTGATVTIGSERFPFSAAGLAEAWSVSAPDSVHVVYASPPSLAAERSRLPGLRTVINWGGDARILTSVITSGLWKTALCLLLLAIAFLVVPFGRPAELGPAGAGRRVALVCGLYAFIYGLVFYSMLDFEDTADPKGDAWEYQAMAVGLAQGQGLNRLGGITPFETYRFRNAADDSSDYRAQCARWGGQFRPYRTPGYPAFLAGVYKVFGIAPARAQQAQLALLFLVAAFLPFLGFAYWKSIGFYAGVIGGLIFFTSWYRLATIIYAECLITFMLCLYALAFLLYERRRSVPYAALLGLVCGAALLVKGDLIFVPLLTLLYLAVLAWKRTAPAWHAAVFALLCVATVAPWSIYASHMSGQPVLLSTQGERVLVEGNNEEVLADGAWHPEYAADPRSFYNQEEIRLLPVVQRVLRFYLARPETIPRMIGVKLTSAFGHFPYLRLAVFFILLWLFAPGDTAGPRSAARLRKAGSTTLLRYGGACVALLAVLVSIPLMFLALAGGLLYAGWKGLLARFVFPASFVVLLGNFLLVSVVIFGDRRFISVIDCFFILTAMRFLLSFLLRWLGPREPALVPWASARTLASLHQG